MNVRTVLFVGIVLLAGCGQSTSPREAERIFGLTGLEPMAANTCVGTMNQHNATFELGGDKMLGCACIVRHVTYDAGRGELNAWLNVVNKLIENSPKDGAGGELTPEQLDKTERDLKEIAATFGISDTRMLEIIRTTSQTMAFCGDPANLAAAKVAAGGN